MKMLDNRTFNGPGEMTIFPQGSTDKLFAVKRLVLVIRATFRNTANSVQTIAGESFFFNSQLTLMNSDQSTRIGTMPLRFVEEWSRRVKAFTPAGLDVQETADIINIPATGGETFIEFDKKITIDIPFFDMQSATPDDRNAPLSLIGPLSLLLGDTGNANVKLHSAAVELYAVGERRANIWDGSRFVVTKKPVQGSTSDNIAIGQNALAHLILATKSLADSPLTAVHGIKVGQDGAPDLVHVPDIDGDITLAQLPALRGTVFSDHATDDAYNENPTAVEILPPKPGYRIKELPRGGAVGIEYTTQNKTTEGFHFYILDQVKPRTAAQLQAHAPAHSFDQVRAATDADRGTGTSRPDAALMRLLPAKVSVAALAAVPPARG